MIKTVGDLGILQFGVNYIFETQLVGERLCGSITRPALLLV